MPLVVFVFSFLYIDNSMLLPGIQESVVGFSGTLPPIALSQYTIKALKFATAVR